MAAPIPLETDPGNAKCICTHEERVHAGPKGAGRIAPNACSLCDCKQFTTTTKGTQKVSCAFCPNASTVVATLSTVNKASYWPVCDTCGMSLHLLIQMKVEERDLANYVVGRNTPKEVDRTA